MVIVKWAAVPVEVQVVQAACKDSHAAAEAWLVGKAWGVHTRWVLLPSAACNQLEHEAYLTLRHESVQLSLSVCA